jgi:hypothetical protein
VRTENVLGVHHFGAGIVQHVAPLLDEEGAKDHPPRHREEHRNSMNEQLGTSA